VITEAEQREAYEWRYPGLKGKNWKIQDVGAWGGLSALDMDITPLPRTITRLPPLYTNGKPDLNTVFEFVKKLINEGIRVEFNCEDQCTFCRFWKRHEVVAGKMSTDGDPVGELFYAAFIQWREAQ